MVSVVILDKSDLIQFLSIISKGGIRHPLLTSLVKAISVRTELYKGEIVGFRKFVCCGFVLGGLLAIIQFSFFWFLES